MKKLISLVLSLLTLAAAITCATPAAGAEVQIFSDVEVGRWSAGAIKYVRDKGYMIGTGDGTFGPEAPITRAEAVAVIWRLASSPEPVSPPPFDDVEESDWYSDAVAWAAENGIVYGVSNVCFAPVDPVTREGLAAMLFRYSSLCPVSVPERADLSAFSDADKADAWAGEALGWAVEAGLLEGTDEGELSPAGYATREQFAAIAERFDESFTLAYNHPVLRSRYTEKPYPLVTDADFYVSPSGDDGADGSFERPFATLSRAALAVRDIAKTAERGGVTVAFMAGDYPMDGVVLTEEDGGTPECPVTYCAYGDGEVTFTGGARVSPEDFVPLEESDRAFIKDKSFDYVKKAKINATVGEVTYSSEAFTRSYGRLDAGRIPNRGGYGEDIYIPKLAEAYEGKLGQMRIRYLMNRFLKYHTFEGVQIIGCIGHEYWKTVFPVTGFDPETGVIYYDVIGPQYGLDEYALEVYLLNISEEVDIKNEYWIDPDSDTLYVYEPDDEVHIVSTVESLVKVEGADNVTFRGITFEGCTGDGVVITADNVAFDRCTVFGIGGRAGLRCTGVGFRMSDCTFAYTAGCGMWFDSGRPVEDLVPTGPYIDNCLIHDMGQKWKNLQNPGIRLKCAVGAVISHCELYHTPCAAISFGYVAEGGRERAIDCVFEYNYIHDVDEDVVDIGCIYTGRSFVNRDNVFRYNIISDIPRAGGKFAIYLDDGMAAQTIYGNIFYDFTDTAIMHSGGQYMNIHDNVFIQTKDAYSEGSPEYGALCAWDKYYNFAFDDEEPNPTPWNSGNFRILYSTLQMRPMPGDEYYELWHDRWPELYEIIDDYDWNDFKDVTNPVNGVENPNCPATPGFCSIYNNYAIGNCENEIGQAVEKFAIRCENNPRVGIRENPLFVNPSLGDYRTKEGADILPIPFELIGRY